MVKPKTNCPSHCWHQLSGYKNSCCRCAADNERGVPFIGQHVDGHLGDHQPRLDCDCIHKVSDK